MPIYEYACKNCEHTLEELQKISDDPLLVCPACGEPQLKRLLSAPRFRLKGSGWYETDFKKDGQRNLAKNEGDAAAGSKTDTADAASAGKADGDKSATKPDVKTAGGKAETEKAAAKPAAKSATPAKSAESKSE